jgi:hypothetical protein
MVDAWPSTVPLGAQGGSFKETPDRNVSSFQPDRGPPLEHRSTSISSDKVEFSTHMIYSDYLTLKAFYRDTLKDGALPFTRKHPYDLAGADLTFKFVAEPAFSDIANMVDLGAVSISLRRLP